MLCSKVLWWQNVKWLEKEKDYEKVHLKSYIQSETVGKKRQTAGIWDEKKAFHEETIRQTRRLWTNVRNTSKKQSRRQKSPGLTQRNFQEKLIPTCHVNIVHQTVMCQHCPPNCHVSTLSTRLSCVNIVHQTVMCQHCPPNCHVSTLSTKLSCVNIVHQTVMCQHYPPNCHVSTLSTKLSCVNIVHQTVMCQHCPPNCHVSTLSTKLSCTNIVHQTVMFSNLSCVNTSHETVLFSNLSCVNIVH